MNWIQSKTNLLRRFPPDVRYLVGISGGRDSIVLLHWLINLGYKELIVCHLNHQLRGRSSDADARFVEKLVERYNRKFVGQAHRLPRPLAGKRSPRPTTNSMGLDFELGSIDVRALAKEKRCRSKLRRVRRATRFSRRLPSAIGATRFSGAPCR